MTSLDFLEIPMKFSSLDAVEYQYFNQLLNHRTIVFNQDVQEDVVERIFLPLRDFEHDDCQEPVTLILNSPGGSVSDGFFLANYLTTYSKPLHIIVAGYAASMAAVILCAGGKNDNIKRSCYPSTYALIHDGYIALATSESKTASDILSYNQSVDADIRKFILTNTEITPEEYDSNTRKQWFLSASDMLKYNIIDEVYGLTKE